MERVSGWAADCQPTWGRPPRMSTCCRRPRAPASSPPAARRPRGHAPPLSPLHVSAAKSGPVPAQIISLVGEVKANMSAKKGSTAVGHIVSGCSATSACTQQRASATRGAGQRRRAAAGAARGGIERAPRGRRQGRRVRLCAAHRLEGPRVSAILVGVSLSPADDPQHRAAGQAGAGGSGRRPRGLGCRQAGSRGARAAGGRCSGR